MNLRQLMKENRYGCIELSEYLVVGMSVQDLDEALKEVFIIEGRYDIPTRRYLFKGVSEHFRPLSLGQDVPLYFTTMKVTHEPTLYKSNYNKKVIITNFKEVQ